MIGRGSAEVAWGTGVFLFPWRTSLAAACFFFSAPALTPERLLIGAPGQRGRPNRKCMACLVPWAERTRLRSNRPCHGRGYPSALGLCIKLPPGSRVVAEKVGVVLDQLDPQAFTPTLPDADGLHLAALDPLQHR